MPVSAETRPPPQARSCGEFESTPAFPERIKLGNMDLNRYRLPRRKRPGPDNICELKVNFWKALWGEFYQI
jgi:hypothetical protein